MAGWSGVVTDAGKALLAQWLGGGTLNFDKAAEGTSTVNSDALHDQTALVSQKKLISIISETDVSNGKKIKLRITSQNITTAHTCNQIGIWASIGGGTSVMIAIFQSTDGQPIPAYSEIPDFVWNFYAIVEMSNTGTFTLTVDTTAVASAQDIEELQNALNGKASTNHTQGIDTITGLQSALDKKSSVEHTHEISDINELQETLNEKSDSGHTHTVLNQLKIQNGISEGSAQVVNVLLQKTTDALPSGAALAALPNGTIILRYIP